MAGKISSSKGRISYIEPNNIAERNGFGINDGSGKNLVWHPEDLTMSVDLQVSIPNRDDCGQVDSEKNINLNKQSFFSGSILHKNISEEDEYNLTDSYTNISFSEIKNGKSGSMEALGISSIDITFDMHFFPVVTMNFTDVRGASLMMPEEMDYDELIKENRANSENGNGERIKTTYRNFFRALFHFPYPIFTLSVKGFYGTRISFNLNVTDFKSTFNSETGNFDIVVKFIGNRYGIYSDIPFKYLIIAPYMYGENNKPNEYWLKNTGEHGTFKFLDGTDASTPIPTFIEFMDRYNNLPDSFSQLIGHENDGFESIDGVVKLRAEKTELSKMLEEHDVYVNNARNSIRAYANKVFLETKYYIIGFSTNSSDNIFNYSYEKSESLYDEYIEKYGNEHLENRKFKFSLDSASNVINDKSELLEMIICNSKSKATFTSEYICDANSTKDINEYNNAVSNINSLFDDDEIGSLNYVIFSKFNKYDEYVGAISRRIDAITENINSLFANNNEEFKNAAKVLLGFKPTIQNVFRMIYAHLDCFMHYFYTETLDVIASHKNKRDVSAETLEKSKKLSYPFTDINTSNSFFIPPFYAQYELDGKGNRERALPPKEYAPEECNFVDNLLRAVDNSKNALDEYKNEHSDMEYNEEGETYDISNAYSFEFFPIGYADLLIGGKNPYSNFRYNDNDYKDTAKNLVQLFINRLASAQAFTNVYSKRDNNASNAIDSAINYEIDNFVTILPEWKRKNLITGLQSILYKDDSTQNSDNDVCKYLDDENLPLTFFEGGSSPCFIAEKSNDVNKIKINNDKYTCGDFKNKTFAITGYTDDFFETFGLLTNYIDGGIYPRKWKYNYRRMELFENFKGVAYKKQYNSEGVSGIEKCKDYNEFIDGIINGTVIPSDACFPFFQEYSGKKIKNAFYDNNCLVLKDKKNIEEIFKNEIEANEIWKIRATAFLSTLLGIDADEILNTNGKDNTAEYAILPEHIKLFIGSQLWYKQFTIKYSISEDFCFTIDKKGIFNNFDKSNGTVTEIGGKNMHELEHSYMSFMNEFEEWAYGEFRTDLYPDLIRMKNGATFDKSINEVINAKVDVACFDIKDESQNKLVNFYIKRSPYLTLTDYNKVSVDSNHIISYIKRLIQRLEELETEREKEADAETSTEEGAFDYSESEKNQKIAIYYTLKDLYDKWLCSNTAKRFTLNDPEKDNDVVDKKRRGQTIEYEDINEYNSFIFTDAYYHNIGNEFYVDIKTLYDMLLSEIEPVGISEGRSVLSFIADIAQRNKLLFHVLPVYNNFYDTEALEHIFTPHDIYDGENYMKRGLGNTYVIMYPHETSHILDMGDDVDNSTKYINDGFDIADTAGNISEFSVNDFGSSKDRTNDFIIPAFGVTVAKQNQSYFKSINISMDSPRQTDYAIYNKFLIVNQEKNGDTNSPVPMGQNLFSVYSNRSYNCNVEMLGCANIMPMMYFQLNNVPMFKGAYQITKVEHHIKAGTMMTKFSGTRIQKNMIPLIDTVIDIEGLLNRISGGKYGDDEETIKIGERENTPSPVPTPVVVPSGEWAKRFIFSAEKCLNAAKERDFAYKILDEKGKQEHEHYTWYNEGAYGNTGNGTSYGGVGLCCAFVSRMINQGFARITENRQNGYDSVTNATLAKYAKDAGANLLKRGFVELFKDEIPTSSRDARRKFLMDNALPGDVVVMERNDSNEAGHIAILLGNGPEKNKYWVSDYRQAPSNEPWVYGDEKPKKIKLYRYSGRIIELDGKMRDI